MNRITFSVPGVPRGKARPRASARVVHTATGPIAATTVHSDRETVAAEKVVLAEFRRRYPRHEPLVGPVLLRFTAVFPITSEFTKAQREAASRGELYHTAKPDKDNIEKLLVDALNGHAWVDDGQVMGGGVKRYGAWPRIDVEIEVLPCATPSPADKRAERRLAEHLDGSRPLGVKPPRTKSKSKEPTGRLREAIATALAKEAPRK